MSKSVGTGPSSNEKRIYRAAVLQRLRNTALHNAHKRNLPPSMNPSVLTATHSTLFMYVRVI